MLRKGAFKSVLLIVLGIALCTSCALLRPRPPIGPVVSELEYKSVEKARSRFSYMGSGYVQMSLRPREQLAAEPVYFSKRPLYGEIQLGDSEDKRYTLVVDESKGTRSGYDTLYIDANNNEDLTDDGKVAGKVLDDGRRTELPLVEVTVEYGGRNYPYHLRPRIYSYGETSVNWSSAGYCEGEVTLGGKTYKVALFDDTCNGTFNDAYEVPREYRTMGAVYARGDTMVIDVDGDGTYAKSYKDTPEMYHVGKYVSLDDTCYELEIAPNGRQITIRETDAPCGHITSEQKDFSAELIGDDGGLKLNGGARRVKVPVGEYRFAACSFEKKDGKDALWRIIGRGVWHQPVIEVNSMERTPLKFGPPLTADITVSKRGDSFSFGLEIKGQGGETYSAGDIERDGRNLEPPRLVIRDEKRQIIARGRFEYG